MSKISDALISLCNGKKKVNYPAFPHEVYVRPLTLEKLLELQIRKEDETEDEQASRFDIESNAYCLCDKKGEQIFSGEEYSTFIEECPADIGLAILHAKMELNDFNRLDADSKKK